jgi:hypothetical protein
MGQFYWKGSRTEQNIPLIRQLKFYNFMFIYNVCHMNLILTFL